MVGCGLLKASFCPSIQIMLTFRDPGSVQLESNCKDQEGGNAWVNFSSIHFSWIFAAVYFGEPVLLCRRRCWSKNHCVRIVLLLPRTPQELILITRQSRRDNKDKTVQNKTPIDFLWGFRVIKRAQTLFKNPEGKPFAWCSQRFASESITCTFIYIYRYRGMSLLLDLLHLSRSWKTKKHSIQTVLKRFVSFEHGTRISVWRLGLFKGHGREKTCCSARIWIPGFQSEPWRLSDRLLVHFKSLILCKIQFANVF